MEDKMDFNIEQLLGKMLENLKSVAKTETVIGQQFQLGDYTCVPIIQISMGYGSGGGSGDEPGKGKGAGGGLGGGINIKPVSFLVTKDNEIQMLNVGKGKGMETFLEKVPDMVCKCMDKCVDMKKSKVVEVK